MLISLIYTNAEFNCTLGITLAYKIMFCCIGLHFTSRVVMKCTYYTFDLILTSVEKVMIHSYILY